MDEFLHVLVDKEQMVMQVQMGKQVRLVVL